MKKSLILAVLAVVFIGAFAAFSFSAKDDAKSNQSNTVTMVSADPTNPCGKVYLACDAELIEVLFADNTTAILPVKDGKTTVPINWYGGFKTRILNDSRTPISDWK